MGTVLFDTFAEPSPLLSFF
jgi:hypothetical protein